MYLAIDAAKNKSVMFAKEQILLQRCDSWFHSNISIKIKIINKMMCPIGCPEKKMGKNMEFFQKCPFSSAKKWHFERPNQRTDSKNLAKHPPKWFIRHLVHAFSIFGRVSSQFLKITFLEAIWRRFTLLKGQKLETGGQARKMPQKSFFLQKWVAYI